MEKHLQLRAMFAYILMTKATFVRPFRIVQIVLIKCSARI